MTNDDMDLRIAELLKNLLHHLETTDNLWATDRIDLLLDAPLEEIFWKIDNHNLIERVRNFNGFAPAHMAKALNTIESLKAENARLREALEYAAKHDPISEWIDSVADSTHCALVSEKATEALSTPLDKTEEK